jgi:TRAP-type C4-dicarboxylate transport system permease small subunit
MARFWRFLMRACGAASALVIGAVVLLVCWDVLARNLALPSPAWVFDVTEFSLPLATLLAAPWLLWRNEHVRIDLLAKLPARVLAGLDRGGAVVGVVVCVAMVWYAIVVLLDAQRSGLMVVKSVTFPEWWLFLPVPLSFGLMAIECLRRAAGLPGGPPVQATHPEAA